MTDTFSPSYYDILGIPVGADTSEVRRAYRRRVQDVHPDTGSGSTDGFLEVTEAYQTLVDRDRRRVYDMYLNGMAMRQRVIDHAERVTPVDSVDSNSALLFDAPGSGTTAGAPIPSRGGRRGGWKRRISSATNRAR